MSHNLFDISAVTKSFYYFLILLPIHVGSFEFRHELQNFTQPQPLVAGLVNSQSGIILCSGSVYSRSYVITSCRCLYSFIAVLPFYKERNATHYKVSVEIVNQTGLEISNFVTHPYCMRINVKKPYRNHFGLIILAKEFNLPNEVVRSLAFISDLDNIGVDLVHLSEESSKCKVLGHHSDSGIIKIGTTEMVMMNSEECLFRLCIPKIGCKGKINRITTRNDFCLKVTGDMRLEARFLEGSLVICEEHVYGVVVSPGSSRYPKVPTIFASVSQYLKNFPTGQ